MTDLQLFAKKPSLALLFPLILVLGLTVLAACGGDDAPPEPTAAVTEAATEAPTEAATEAPTEAATPIATATATATATEAPTAAPPAPGYPREVVDLVGRTVTIPDKPSAIVAISPTATELVYAVGGTIIGRTQSVNYPPRPLKRPRSEPPTSPTSSPSSRSNPTSSSPTRPSTSSLPSATRSKRSACPSSSPAPPALMRC